MTRPMLLAGIAGAVGALAIIIGIGRWWFGPWRVSIP